MNKTSKDYQKELTEGRQRVKSLESRIQSRLVKMIDKFPDAVVYHKDGNTFNCRNVSKEWFDNLTIDTMLVCMRNIEEHNAAHQPHVQLDLFSN